MSFGNNSLSGEKCSLNFIHSHNKGTLLKISHFGLSFDLINFRKNVLQKLPIKFPCLSGQKYYLFMDTLSNKSSSYNSVLICILMFDN